MESLPEPLSLRDSILVRKVPVAHTAQAFPFSCTGKEEGNLFFTEAFPFVIKFTLD